jgi:hypothetical protein
VESCGERSNVPSGSINCGVVLKWLLTGGLSSNAQLYIVSLVSLFVIDPKESMGYLGFLSGFTS